MAKARTNKVENYKKLNGGAWIRAERRLGIYLRDRFFLSVLRQRPPHGQAR